MEFCKAFNAQTQDLEPEMPIPTTITIYQDKSFTFTTKTPPASYLLKKAANLPKGGSTPGRETAGTVTKQQINEIAEQKMNDLNANTLEQAAKIIAGFRKVYGFPK